MKKYFLVYIIGLLLASFLVSPVKADILPSVPTQNELVDLAGKPTHRVNIPGLSYTDIKQVQESDGTYLYIPFMGEYISAIYRYLVIAAGLVAVIVIIVAGIQWTASGGNSSTIESAKKRITGALTGLGLAVGSYVILYTINPNLVNFQSLKIKYISTVPMELDYDEGEDPNQKVTPSGYKGGAPKPSGKAKCIYDTFTPGIALGQKPPTKNIDMFNLGISVPVNINSYSAWEKVSNEILASSDPEVQGYLQYMRDFKAKKVPDLLGEKDGAGAVSQSLGRGIGVSRHPTGGNLGSVVQDMHVMGLAVDFMTRSNWDINWGGTKRGKAAKPYCQNYQKTINKMRNGDYDDPNKGISLKSDPYKMYTRLDKKIADCFNQFDNGNSPFTSLPQGFIDIFTRNKFYWGGYGWGNKMRTDGMHFEYWGDC